MFILVKDIKPISLKGKHEWKIKIKIIRVPEHREQYLIFCLTRKKDFTYYNQQ